MPIIDIPPAPPDEPINERHNRVVGAIATYLAKAFDPLDSMVVLESLLAGQVSMMKLKAEHDDIDLRKDIIDIIAAGAKDRIVEMERCRKEGK